MRRVLALFAALILIGAAALWLVTQPERIDASDIAGFTPDPARGEAVFHAAGCAGCHAALGATGEARLILSGGRRFASPFGTFVAPNVSSDPAAGIGGWTDAEIVTAIARGTGRDGSHLYPAFPYSTYVRADLGDLVSLAAYLRTLPPDPTPSQPHELAFPFNIRAGLGLWKLLYLDAAPVIPVGQELERGRYLVEALGHCGECHTPRDALGGPDTARWLAGGPNPSGSGKIPNITPGGLTWSAVDIALYLESGITPDFDSAGGGMAEVIRSTSQLSDEDRAAIAAYLKAVPAVK